VRCLHTCKSKWVKVFVSRGGSFEPEVAINSKSADTARCCASRCHGANCDHNCPCRV
jgi:hypothetical protein